jgi:hypothetical protein
MIRLRHIIWLESANILYSVVNIEIPKRARRGYFVLLIVC